MKKYFLSIFTVMISVSSFAQFSFGPKVGINYSNITGTIFYNDKPNYLIGFNAGVFVDFKSADVFSFHSELDYSIKGYKYNINGLFFYPGYPGSMSGTNTLKYLDIPILLQANVARFYFQTGPLISLLIGESNKETITQNPPTGSPIVKTYTDVSTSGLNVVDVGAALGVGYHTKSGIDFGVRANFGISNINKPAPKGSTSSVPTNNNRCFQASIGYAFGGKKKSK